MAEIVKGGKHVGESKECVALVKHLNPDVGRAADWKKTPGRRFKEFGKSAEFYSIIKRK